MKTKCHRLCRSLLFTALLVPLGAAAQSGVPEFISYQGRVSDASGLVGAGTPVNRTVTFRIWNHPTNVLQTHLIYSEEQTVTISEGKFSVLVGQGVPTTSSLIGFDETPFGKPTKTIADAFGDSERYIGITVDDGNGGTVDNEVTPRQQVVTSAFSFRSKVAETLGTSTGTALTVGDTGKIGVGTTTPISLFTITGPNTTSSTSTPQLLITDSADTNESLRIGVDSTGNGSGFIQSFKTGTAAQNLLLNPQGGNVGIGTTNPGAPLDIQNAIKLQTDLSEANNGAARLFMSEDSSDNFGFSMIFNGKNSGTPVFNGTTVGAVPLNFFGIARHNGTGAGLPALVISRTNGNVGIGATNPASPLHVHSTNLNPPLIRMSSGDHPTGVSLRLSGDDLIIDNGGTATFSRGVVVLTGNGGGVQIFAGQTAWSAVSDRNKKKNFVPTDGDEILEKLSTIPIHYWNYKWDSDDDTPHIGPVAQDFIPAFYPGRDETQISTLEFDGVELAAIQALHRRAEVRAEEVADLKAVVEALQKRLTELEAKDKARDAKLAAIEAMLSGGKADALPVSLKKVAAAAVAE